MIIPLTLRAVLVLCFLSLGGCARFDSSIKYQDIELRLPKDARWDVLRYRREFLDVLGRPVVTELMISNASFVMNPHVIDARTRRDVELFKAGANAAAALIGAIPK